MSQIQADPKISVRNHFFISTDNKASPIEEEENTKPNSFEFGCFVSNSIGIWERKRRAGRRRLKGEVQFLAAGGFENEIKERVLGSDL